MALLLSFPTSAHGRRADDVHRHAEPGVGNPGRLSLQELAFDRTLGEPVR
jgi:hypothetical protein